MTDKETAMRDMQKRLAELAEAMDILRTWTDVVAELQNALQRDLHELAEADAIRH